MNRLLLLTVALLVSCPGPALAAKTDIVILKNGDRITGEVKGLESRLLEFSTDTMGTVNIEWRFIDRVVSKANQSITTIDGDQFFGKLAAIEDSDAIGIQTPTEIIELDPDKVFSVWPVEATWWEKTDFDISVGYDYTKSTEITDFNLSVDWLHRKTDRLSEASLRSDITQQEGADDQKSTQLAISHQFLRPEKKFRSLLGNYEANDSLGIEHRIYAGGTLGKYMILESNHWLSLAGGLVGTLEEFSDGTDQSSLELLGNIRFNYFRYADPERSLDSRLTVFPSLTESGRLRTDFRTTFKLEFVKDLFWSMEVYYQSDNEPSAGAADNDYGITTSLGWSN